jgi:NADH:ubiquinone oxidoreductase subunit F (NADH-binding)/(2Fe-2S) ferredoxin/NAD-dependent dihydropyrimidine dehydrogenase PreA subunit
MYRMKLLICTGSGCVSNGALRIKEAFEEELKKHDLQEEIQLVTTGCRGYCAKGPMVYVEPEGIVYQIHSPETVPGVVKEHFLEGKPVQKLMYTSQNGGYPVPKMKDIGFFGKQRLVALANRGVIDPEKIDEYIARDGYRALAKALTRMTPEGIIEEIKRAGLRGRGGAGFPTGKKWEICRNQPGDEKYIICNADEGDPGAFMDRSIVESDPHAVIEGMLIGARAIGANHGFVYIRNEYPLALKCLMTAIRQAKEYGLLGDDILGSGFSFDLSVARGAGAFVCGEETSLINSLMGKSPQPRVKPPFPAQSGYNGKPTNINNVETWANVPRIINYGADWFSSIGTETSKGTKVFSLVGKVNNTGLVEVPMGITLREIIYDIGDGIPNGKKFKAVQTGGPSGGCIPESMIDIQVDYESLTKAGCIMGSGGMIVMDETTCMVEVARYFLSFTQEESCGKCVPCRIGTKRMLERLTAICEGRGEEGDLEFLEEMAYSIKDSALCGLGQTAPNPVLTTIRYFRDEYIAHIEEKRCPSGVCKALIHYEIIPEACVGCHACFKVCPSDAITGKAKEVHVIHQDKCIKCGMCNSTCRYDAIKVV